MPAYRKRTSSKAQLDEWLAGGGELVGQIGDSLWEVELCAYREYGQRLLPELDTSPLDNSPRAQARERASFEALLLGEALGAARDEQAPA